MEFVEGDCTVNIDDNKIVCEYIYQLGKKVKWTIFLKDKIEYVEGSTTGNFSKEDAQEFVFEIRNLTHVTLLKPEFQLQAVFAYIIQKDGSDPKEFFRFYVREQATLTSKTVAYRLANNILKVLSEKYLVPYAFKYSVNTKKKSKQFWWSMILGFLAMLLGMLFGFMRVYSSS